MANEYHPMRKIKRPSRPKPTIQSIAMEYVEEAFQAIVQISRYSPDESLRLKANSEIVDRAYGRPPQLNAKDLIQPVDYFAAALHDISRRGSKAPICTNPDDDDDDIDEYVEP